MGHCVRLQETGGPDVLSYEAFDPPAPGPGEIRFEVAAAGLNFIDTYHRSGLYPIKLPAILGAESAGTVDAVGEGVEDIGVGDRVGFIGPRAYASHVVAPASGVVRLPDTVSFETAAAVLLKGLTAWMLLFEVRPVSPGETALVWAPVGGVGSLLVPWARSFGMRVIGVTSTAEKAQAARDLGAADVVLRTSEVAADVRALTGDAGVDVSYDSVGKSSADASLGSLKPRGWWISYGNASGAADPVAPGRLGALGSLVLTRPSLFSFIATQEDLSRGASALFGALAVGTISAQIGQTFALADAADAHRAIESGKTTGATLLLP
ncbi:MAG: quinone oxidoreductase [Pseudomonadota bacterium]